jgi:glutamine synthetase
MEINFFHAHPLGLADEVFFFKRTVREAALRHDMYATFMAKPIAGEPGSAMHVHQSIINKATGRTSSAMKTARRQEEFCWYIGGLQSTRRPRWRWWRPMSTATAACARHGRAHQHPVGHRQPHRGHPQPDGAPAARRVENRVIGADANPYVALAMTLACGYLGMKNKIEPSPNARATPTWAPFRCRAAWAKR